MARVDCTSGSGKAVCAAFGVGKVAPIPCTLFVSREKALYKYVQVKDTVLDFERLKAFIDKRQYLEVPKLLLDKSLDHYLMVNDVNF